MTSTTTEMKLATGTGRIWESAAGKFGWAHPDGSQGEAESFDDAVRALDEIDRDAGLLNKLNSRYPTAKFTVLANAGDFEAAAEAAAGVAWGLWADLRRVAGLDYDHATRCAWIAAHTPKGKHGSHYR
jgi:hypothetical protein